MSCPTNQNLTPEKYQEIKNKLESENLESFPSVFQQARNLAKQAWLSGVDVAKGKPLLSTAEKAAERIKICEGCEFYKQSRCIKCGCFMTAKIHLESSRCPINKWGPELQTMNSPEQENAAMTLVEQPVQNFKQNQLPPKAMNATNLPRQSEEIWVASTINNIVAQMSKMIDYPEFETKFPYKGNEYIIKKIKPPTPVVIEVGASNGSNFNDLVKKHSDPSEPKTFDFNNEQYFVDTDSNKNEPPRVFKINKDMMQHAFSPVDRLDSAQ